MKFNFAQDVLFPLLKALPLLFLPYLILLWAYSGGYLNLYYIGLPFAGLTLVIAFILVFRRAFSDYEVSPRGFRLSEILFLALLVLALLLFVQIFSFGRNPARLAVFWWVLLLGMLSFFGLLYSLLLSWHLSREKKRRIACRFRSE